MGTEGLSDRIARSLRTLRDARGLTQEQVARLAGVPRATWANLEAGGGNPTLAVLHRVAGVLQVPLEELIAEPRAACRFYPRDQLTEKRGGDVRLRNLLPDPLPGMVLDRMDLPPRSQLTGVPHMPGTREYLACEAGTIVLAAAGERWTLRAGDVVVFRGDQRHSYRTPAPSSPSATAWCCWSRFPEPTLRRRSGQRHPEERGEDPGGEADEERDGQVVVDAQRQELAARRGERDRARGAGERQRRGGGAPTEHEGHDHERRRREGERALEGPVARCAGARSGCRRRRRAGRRRQACR